MHLCEAIMIEKEKEEYRYILLVIALEILLNRRSYIIH